MTKVSIELENLQRAYKEGCSDVKRVLENLFPEELSVYYSYGDMFSSCSDRKKPIMLCCTGNSHVAFVDIEKGVTYSGANQILVRDVTRIPESDLADAMLKWDFKRISKATK